MVTLIDRLTGNKYLLMGTLFGLLLVSVGVWFLLREASLVIIVPLWVGFAIICLLAGGRRTQIAVDHSYRQMDALLSVVSTIQPRFPLPSSAGWWVAKPDFLRLLTQEVLRAKPDVVVELGSGLSTVVVAYCLQKNGRGRLLSFDHEAVYAGLTRKTLADHGLQDVATVVHAPLIRHEIAGESWTWYKTEGVEIAGPVDLLVVDGPPRIIQRMARYPALPLFRQYMHSGSFVLMDDGALGDEREVVKRWVREFAEASSEYVDLEKGAFIVRLDGKAKA